MDVIKITVPHGRKFTSVMKVLRDPHIWPTNWLERYNEYDYDERMHLAATYDVCSDLWNIFIPISVFENCRLQLHLTAYQWSFAKEVPAFANLCTGEVAEFLTEDLTNHRNERR